MRASSHELALALAQRIGTVLPPPLTAAASGPHVELHADGARVGGSAAAAIADEEDDRTFAERVETATLAVLSTLQDDVAEYLTVEWPREADGAMALPGARVAGGRVHLWFGRSESAPAVGFDPIPCPGWRRTPGRPGRAGRT